MEEKKKRSIGWLLGRINLIITLLILVPYFALYGRAWYISWTTGTSLSGEVGGGALLITLISFFNTPLLISILSGAITAVVEIIHKKKHSMDGLMLNLVSGLLWFTFYTNVPPLVKL